MRACNKWSLNSPFLLRETLFSLPVSKPAASLQSWLSKNLHGGTPPSLFLTLCLCPHALAFSAVPIFICPTQSLPSVVFFLLGCIIYWELNELVISTCEISPKTYFLSWKASEKKIFLQADSEHALLKVRGAEILEKLYLVFSLVG